MPCSDTKGMEHGIGTFCKMPSRGGSVRIMKFTECLHVHGI